MTDTEPFDSHDTIAARALTGSFYSVSASMITLALGFIRSVLLARLLLPEHFGVVALALFYIGLASRLKGFGFGPALIHRQDADEPFMRTYFALYLGLGLATTAALWMAAPLLQRFYPDMTELMQVLRVLAVAYFTSELSQVQETLLRKNLAFGRLAAMDVASSLTMTVVAPFLAWRGWGVWALVAEQVSGFAVRFILSWGPFRQWNPGLGWEKAHFRWLWEFGRPSWVATNTGYLLDRFDDFWVGTALGKIPLGYYSKAYEFARYPRRVFANPLTSVFGPVYAKLQKDRLALSRAFFRSSHVILRTGFLVCGLFALVMPEFIHWVIGDRWMPMLWTFRLMLVYTALDPVLMLFGNLMLAVGRPWVLQRVRMAQLAFFVPAVVVGAHLWGINGVALAADGMLAVGVWRFYPYLREVVDFSPRRLALWPAVALFLGMALRLVGEAYLTDGTGLLCLAAKTGLFTALYLGILTLAEGRDYFRGLSWLGEYLWDRKVSQK